MRALTSDPFSCRRVLESFPRLVPLFLLRVDRTDRILQIRRFRPPILLPRQTAQSHHPLGPPPPMRAHTRHKTLRSPARERYHPPDAARPQSAEWPSPRRRPRHKRAPGLFRSPASPGFNFAAASSSGIASAGLFNSNSTAPSASCASGNLRRQLHHFGKLRTRQCEITALLRGKSGMKRRICSLHRLWIDCLLRLSRDLQ